MMVERRSRIGLELRIADALQARGWISITVEDPVPLGHGPSVLRVCLSRKHPHGGYTDATIEIRAHDIVAARYPGVLIAMRVMRGAIAAERALVRATAN